MIKNLEDLIPGCEFFKWKEAILLPQWSIFAIPQDIVAYNNIVKTAQKMDEIRKFLGQPIKITSFYRPEPYNQFIKGARLSAHREGLACDFLVKGMTSNEARVRLHPKLSEFNVRMEAIETVHVHIDLKVTRAMTEAERFFLP